MRNPVIETTKNKDGIYSAVTEQKNDIITAINDIEDYLPVLKDGINQVEYGTKCLTKINVIF